MATYGYNFHGTYREFEGPLAKVDNDPATGTLSNGALSDVFVAEEPLTNDGESGPAISDLYGVYTDGDVTIILTLNSEVYYAWANVDNPETYQFPESIPFASISTADFAFCFLSGTQIATPSGPIPVESLRIGHVVCTADGGRACVKWIGRQSVTTAFGPPEIRWPVLVRAGSLGEGIPAADLRVTSDHALLVEGLLIQAGAMVNGHSVRRLTKGELGDRYTVYHIETEHHDMVLAEGTAAETFVDNVSRRHFDNHAEYTALYGEVPSPITEVQRPRIKSARQLPRSIRARLEARSRALGCAAPAVA
jgi:hypothetical protein